MTTFILVPGAWLGGWVWEPVVRGLQERGHTAHAMTLSGLDGRGAPAAEIGLATHVDDVLSLLEKDDSHDVIVVGHLYSGLVAGQVADRAPDRVAHTVFLEAFLPHDGQRMVDAFDEDEKSRQAEIDQIARNEGLWPPPSAQDVAQESDLSAEQQRELVARFVAHPGRTVTEPARLARPLSAQRATYIACTKAGHWASADVAAMRTEPNWTFRTLDAGHWPMVSVPTQLVAMLDRIAREEARSRRGPRR